MHFPIIAGDKAADFVFALDDNRERRRLHAPDGRQKKTAVLAIEGGHRARAVNPDQPVGLCAAARGGGERLHVPVAPQPFKRVIDCIQTRATGWRALAYCTIVRKINSPSRPASHVLIKRSISLRLISLLSSFKRASFLAMGRNSKCGGITGKCAKLHLPRLTSYSSGAVISSRCPSAAEST